MDPEAAPSDPDHDPQGSGERLSKHLARQLGCSRSQAEHYIESGFVSVDGVMIDTPQFRVGGQTVELAPQANLAPVAPATMLLHLPPEATPWPAQASSAPWLTAARQADDDRSGLTPVRRHFVRLDCVAPLAGIATGLIVFSQDPRVRRKLLEDAASLEHEWMIDLEGEPSPETIAMLGRPAPAEGRDAPIAKVSVSHQGAGRARLRLAGKGIDARRLAARCVAAAIEPSGLRRTRLGRVSLAGLEPGRWRYLLPTERF